MKDLKQRVDSLPPERKSLLALLLKKKNGAAETTPELVRLATMLREQTAQRSLVTLQAGGAGYAFFCVHPVGGGVLSYFDLARCLSGAGHPVYGLQARGLDGEQAPSSNIEKMAAHYIEEVRTVQPTGPYHLGGWSLGGVIAFEMTRQLLAQGETVPLLALFDSDISEANRTVARAGGVKMLMDFANELGIRPSVLGVAWDEVEQLETHKQLGFVLESARSAGLVPPYVTYEVADNLFSVFQSNLKAFANYLPRPAPCRALLFTATERAPAISERQRLSWNSLAQQGVEVYAAGGNHHTMLQTPHVETLAARLNAHLTTGKEVSAS